MEVLNEGFDELVVQVFSELLKKAGARSMRNNRKVAASR